MTFCSKCGASLEPNSSYCPSCGSSVGLAGQTDTFSTPTPPPMPPPPSYAPGQYIPLPLQRPTGITILAILAGLGGLASIIFGFAFGLLGFALLIIGLIEFAVAYGYWTGASWGWWLGIIGAALDIASILAINVVGFLIGLIMLYYLTRPHVKAWFRHT